LYKIGVTIVERGKRIAQHNRNFEEYAGKVVQEADQRWELKTYLEVPDLYWAEKAFWGATIYGVLPGRGGVGVKRMEWAWVEQGLNAAKKAGVRPLPLPRTTAVRNREGCLNSWREPASRWSVHIAGWSQEGPRIQGIAGRCGESEVVPVLRRLELVARS
jgi:hypothetical protein